MYQALYRKWRPLTFDDVVAQPHITTTLRRQLASGRTAHAYLFTGSRGTGKTTCARIFAKALNCLNPKDGSPCLECEICRDAEAGTLSDLIEIDAASNNSVDDVRDLREGAVFTPERCRKKVYIIDEVHMLSVNAFNALLKIMEEPPSYVTFLLATTEVHKVPATVLSRCQRFDFQRFQPADISARLLYIAEREEFTLDSSAADLIARIADGGLRDAINLLDQCTAYDSHVTLDTVSAASGIAGRDSLFLMLEAVTGGDAGTAMELVDQLYGASKDMQRLCEEMISQFRNLMLVKTVPAQTQLLACLPEERKKLQEMAGRLELSRILGYLNELQNCGERLARSLNKRVELEMCLIRLCTSFRKEAAPSIPSPSPGGNPIDNSGWYDKLKRLEEAVARLSAAGASGPAPAERGQPDPVPAPPASFSPPPPGWDPAPYDAIPPGDIPVPMEAAPPMEAPVSIDTPVPVDTPPPSLDAAGKKARSGKKPSSPPEARVDLSQLRPEDFRPCGQWPEVLDELYKVNPAVSGTLQGSRAFVNGDVMLIQAENPFFLKLFKQKENAQILHNTVRETLGKTYLIRAKSNAVQREEEQRVLALLERAEQNGIPTETLDGANASKTTKS